METPRGASSQSKLMVMTIQAGSAMGVQQATQCGSLARPQPKYFVHPSAEVAGH